MKVLRRIALIALLVNGHPAVIATFESESLSHQNDLQDHLPEARSVYTEHVRQYQDRIQDTQQDIDDVTDMLNNPTPHDASDGLTPAGVDLLTKTVAAQQKGLENDKQQLQTTQSLLNTSYHSDAVVTGALKQAEQSFTGQISQLFKNDQLTFSSVLQAIKDHFFGGTPTLQGFDQKALERACNRYGVTQRFMETTGDKIAAAFAQNKDSRDTTWLTTLKGNYPHHPIYRTIIDRLYARQQAGETIDQAAVTQIITTYKPQIMQEAETRLLAETLKLVNQDPDGQSIIQAVQAHRTQGTQETRDAISTTANTLAKQGIADRAATQLSPPARLTETQSMLAAHTLSIM